MRTSPTFGRKGLVWSVVLIVVLLLSSASFVVRSGDSPTHVTVTSLGSLRSSSNPQGPVIEFQDNFTTDSSLNTSAWVTNGPAATAMLTYQGSSLLSAVTPSISFSPSQGLTLSGATADYTFAALQTLRTFSPPFAAQARMMATVSNGNTLAFALTTANAGQGVYEVGAFNSSNPYYAIGALASPGPAAPWVGVQVFDSAPSLNTWYTLDLAVDASGVATMSLAQSTTVIGTANYYVGLGAYYLFLGQFVDAPPVAGGNSAAWSSVSVNYTPAPPSPPTLVGMLADPATVVIGASTVFHAFILGGALPLTEVYSGLPPGCSSHSTLTLLCIPTAVGNYTVKVNATDSLGRSTVGETNLSIESATTPPPPALQLSGVIADPGAISLGESTTFDVFVSGGAPPIATAYTGLPPGCATRASLTLGCTPTQTGVYTVHVTVTDAQGRSATGESNLTVGPGPTPSSAPLFTSGDAAAFGVGAAGVAFGVAALLLGRRRPAPESKAP